MSIDLPGKRLTRARRSRFFVYVKTPATFLFGLALGTCLLFSLGSLRACNPEVAGLPGPDFLSFFRFLEQSSDSGAAEGGAAQDLSGRLGGLLFGYALVQGGIAFALLRFLRSGDPEQFRRIALLSILPGVSPGFILGVPFGFWGLAAHNRERAALERDETNH